MKEFSAATRQQLLETSNQKIFDLAIIGGGIVGAGIARDAALRGLSVCLLEKGDFGSGTSSRSTKLVHGGLRYLEQLDFGLVAEACAERHLLLTKLAPHLVKPMSFVLPVYENRGSGLAKIKMGMILYDLLALFRNVHNHRSVTVKEIEQKLPGLHIKGLKGGFLYYDAETWDARLVLANILDANNHGATMLSYVSAHQPLRENQLWKIPLTDVLHNKDTMIRAKHVVNATGPWQDQMMKTHHLRLAKGVHIVLPWEKLPLQMALMWEIPSDGRRIFMIPRGPVTLVGTTDTDYEGTPDNPVAQPKDIDYLLNGIRDAFPDCAVNSKDILHTYAGVRPLVAEEATTSSLVSRKHTIIEQEGIFYISGGKLTTFRKMAEDFVNKITKEKCVSHKTPLPESPIDALLWGKEKSTQRLLAQKNYAEQFEMVIQPEDFYLRRTPLAFWGDKTYTTHPPPSPLS